MTKPPYKPPHRKGKRPRPTLKAIVEHRPPNPGRTAVLTCLRRATHPMLAADLALRARP